MRMACVIALPLLCTALYSQNTAHPLTQVEACKQFSDSVVQVITDGGSGTGFIVGKDGWIATAFHVIADVKTLTTYNHPRIVIGKLAIDAVIVSSVDREAQNEDFAILRIEKKNLTALEFGNSSDVEIGSPLAVIGYPLSAFMPIPGTAVPKFCLSGTMVAQTTVPLPRLRYLHVIYFQGVSVKGISGAPVISLVSGKVIGIVSTKLTGIGPALQKVRDDAASFQSAAAASGVTIQVNMNGLDPSTTVPKIITVLDDQLANGLGTAIGVDRPTEVLRNILSDHKTVR